MSDLQTFQKTINYHFRNPQLFAEALLHPSRKISSSKGNSFQRLEFLGDRVLGLVIATYLYNHFPLEKEGELARRLSAIVSRESCHEIGQVINLQSILSSDTEGGSVLADAVEALIGAIYLDGGLEVAQSFVTKFWCHHFEDKLPFDPKTALQEWVQQKYKAVPAYEVLRVSGPDHAPTFKVRVMIAGLGAAEAEGPSKKQAERFAAQAFWDEYCLGE